MDTTSIRYKFNPVLTDTVGFYDYCIPLTNESIPPPADSLQKYYDYSVYNYITPPPAPKEFAETTSVFGTHQLMPVHKGPVAINRQSTDWITMLLLLCLLLFAWIQTVSHKRFVQIIKAVIQPHSVNQLEREGNLFRERITLGLGAIYYIIGSVFILQLFKAFNTLPAGFDNLSFAALISGVLFSYQMLKSLLIYTSGIIFKTAESSRAYQLNTLIFNHIAGIVLFPFVIMAFYYQNTSFLIIGGVIASLLFVYRLFRGILTGLNNKNYNLLYLFLYLCTLEILPLLLLVKVVSKM
jgi:hypothetical protein